MGETTAVAHGAWVCVRNLRPHRCKPRGNPLWRHCLPCSEAASLQSCFPFPLPLGRPVFDPNRLRGSCQETGDRKQ
ncbi:MAG: hypothetical protein F6J90_07970 [Moorea sp. SIOASIH]|uniref:hypothetical protein n=1 Tax=Moorena sp. SIOASIH TaxID=2607817 RepID=UPI0013BAE326|nr:hypothetical protein [Moorena sp. SIOASIH]NEO36254.1 hypothetical protein [Moorena sp. SIOASIH]NEO36260.1 hypothetical protein [Moorena sp. SIOASIH]